MERGPTSGGNQYQRRRPVPVPYAATEFNFGNRRVLERNDTDSTGGGSVEVEERGAGRRTRTGVVAGSGSRSGQALESTDRDAELAETTQTTKMIPKSYEKTESSNSESFDKQGQKYHHRNRRHDNSERGPGPGLTQAQYKEEGEYAYDRSLRPLPSGPGPGEAADIEVVPHQQQEHEEEDPYTGGRDKYGAAYYEDGINLPPPPSNYWILALLSTICCCLPIGALALYNSYLSTHEYQHARLGQAAEKGRNAKMLSILAIACGIVMYTAIAVYVGVQVSRLRFAIS